MKNNKLFVLAILLFQFVFLSYGFSEEKTSVTEKWTLAPQEFSGKETYKKILPNIILESFPEDIFRDITEAEQEYDFINKLEQEKKSLISKLLSTQKEKDQLFFENSDSATKNKKKLELEEKIQEIKTNIEKIDLQIQTEFRYQKKEKKIDISKSFVDLDFLDNPKKNRNINGVLTGSVTEQNGFIYVKAKITVIAKENFSYETSAVGSYSEIQKLSSEISQNFLSFIMNKDKIQVSVSVFPEEIVENAIITINGVSFKNHVEALVLQQGTHSFSISAPGYNTRSFTADLTDSTKSYKYSVYLKEAIPEEVNIFVNEKILENEKVQKEDVALYIGGIKQTFDSEATGLYSTALVDRTPILGEFTVPLYDEIETILVDKDENGNPLEEPYEEKKIKYASTFFRLTGDSIKPIQIKTESSTTLIEKARKRMYTSYGLLLISLPISFYANGRLNDIINSMHAGVDSKLLLDKYNTWNVTSKISWGVTITAGINMIIQLGRYIYTANTVLPQNR